VIKKITHLLLLSLILSPTASVWADPSGPPVNPSIPVIPDQPPIIPSFSNVLNQIPVPPPAPNVPNGGTTGSGGSTAGTMGSTSASGTTPVSDTVVLDLTTDAKVTKETNSDGQAVTKVAVDEGKLNDAFSGQIQTVVVEINGTDPVVKVDLPANALVSAVNKQPKAKVYIKTDGASYRLPVSVLKSMPKDTAVTVTITKVSGKKADDVNAEVQQAGSQSLLDNPVDFNVSINGEEVTDFQGVYVDRTLTVKSLADPSKVTAVWFDTNNKMNFIPSSIINNNGSLEVTIHSQHNSIYTVIQSNKSFADLQGHWAKSDVELLANKMIVDGVEDNSFAPDNNITRAEFAALLVRSLGLVEVKSDHTFTDVNAADWYAGVVGTAQKAGFISGYEDGTFRPNAWITREQMVSMIVRALKVGGKEVKADPSLLTKFTDEPFISDWAKDAVSATLSAGILQGTNDTTFAAQDHATRAQAVTVLKRALQYLQFIS
jgi:hypothetical protein